MKPLAEIIKAIDFQEKEDQPDNRSKMELQELPKNSELSINEFSPKDVVKITQALGACLMVQRTYGKQGNDIDKITKIFLEVLDKYEPERVIQAVKKWIGMSEEFPTPADIERILNPKPEYDKAVYLSLKEKNNNGGWLTTEQ